MESSTLELSAGAGSTSEAPLSPASKVVVFRGTSMSFEGFCLTEQGIRRLDRSTFRKLWLIAAWGPELRTFARWGEQGEYLADVITGSLYNDDGTSPAGSPLYLSSTKNPSRSRRLQAEGAHG